MPHKNKADRKVYEDQNRSHIRTLHRDWSTKNRDACRENSRRWYLNNKRKLILASLALRREVIDFYGGRCACCDQTELNFLALDHRNNDGNVHRRVVRGNMYQWAKKSNFPNILQVLCHNCNLAKTFYGICPHKINEDRTEFA